MKVSAIVRTHNCERTIESSVKSIVDIVDEIIVVDNISTDNTVNIIESLISSLDHKVNIKFYRYNHAIYWPVTSEASVNAFEHDPRHMTSYQNFCLEKTSYDWVMRLDGDCVVSGLDKFKLDNIIGEADPNNTLWVSVSNVIGKNKRLKPDKTYDMFLFCKTKYPKYIKYKTGTAYVKHIGLEPERIYRKDLDSSGVFLYHFGRQLSNYSRGVAWKERDWEEVYVEINPFYDQFEKYLNFVIPVYGERFEKYAERLVRSIETFYPEANIFLYHGDHDKITIDKFKIANELINKGEIFHGSLIIMDADTAILRPCDDFFYFADTHNNDLHITYDTGGTIRDIDDMYKLGKVGGTYVSDDYWELFGNSASAHLDEHPFNAGVIVFNLDKYGVKDKIKELAEISDRIKYSTIWPMEQGLLTIYIHQNNLEYTTFGSTYNSTGGEHNDPGLEDKIKIMHYHDDARFNEKLYNKKINIKTGKHRRPTLHLLGLGHTITREDFSHCAFTMKTRKMAKMMGAMGYEVLHYGVEGPDVEQYKNVKHIDVVDNNTWQAEYGDFEKEKYQFKYDTYGTSWRVFQNNAKDKLGLYYKSGDLILSSFGHPHAFAMEFGPVIEMGIGYSHRACFAPYRVYESYAWMNECRAREDSGNPKAYHVVIPNYFDLKEFAWESSDKKSYFAFLGRMNVDKGIETACLVAEDLGIPLKAAGQLGGPDDKFVKKLKDQYKMFEHIGTVGIKERSDFLKGSIATFVPTHYPEPFGGVAVESMLCGTPVITSDWGAFPETVIDGVTGYRCRTLKDYIDAGKNIIKKRELVSWPCREHGEKYSLENIGLKYDKYFKDVQRVIMGEGWYELSADWY